MEKVDWNNSEGSEKWLDRGIENKNLSSTCVPISENIPPGAFMYRSKSNYFRLNYIFEKKRLCRLSISMLLTHSRKHFRRVLEAKKILCKDFSPFDIYLLPGGKRISCKKMVSLRYSMIINIVANSAVFILHLNPSDRFAADETISYADRFQCDDSNNNRPGENLQAEIPNMEVNNMCIYWN